MRLIGVRVIPDAKITRYLLDPAHPIGGAKARFFLSRGFSLDAPDMLATALLLHADAHPVHAERAHSRGVNRVVKCRIATPDGSNPCVNTVWVQEHGLGTQRLVTAYPE